MFILSFFMIDSSLILAGNLRGLCSGSIAPLSIQYITKLRGCKTIYCFTAFIRHSTNAANDFFSLS